MNITLDIDLNEFKKQSTDDSDKAFIAAMGQVGGAEEDVLEFLVMSKLGLDYEGDDRVLFWDCASVWEAARKFYQKTENNA
jgi:hypothetical protein